MNIGWILGISLLVSCGSLLLRQYHPAYAILLSATGCCFLLAGYISPLKEIFLQIQELLNNSGEGKEWIGLLVKALGICYICRFGADLCRDAGQTAMAGYVELAGRILLISLSIPMLGKVLTIIIGLTAL